MKFPRNAKLFRGQLDAAPFASLFFLLVIFLLLNSSLVFTPGIRMQMPVRIQVPQTDGPAMPGLAGPSTVVVMDLSGQLYYENQLILENDLKLRLRSAAQKNPHLTLIVQADKSVNLEAFYRLGKLANDAGLEAVLLASRPPIFPPKGRAPALP